MNYKLKNVNGKVTFLLRTGKDLVKIRWLLLRHSTLSTMARSRSPM